MDLVSLSRPESVEDSLLPHPICLIRSPENDLTQWAAGLQTFPQWNNSPWPSCLTLTHMTHSIACQVRDFLFANFMCWDWMTTVLVSDFAWREMRNLLSWSNNQMQHECYKMWVWMSPLAVQQISQNHTFVETSQITIWYKHLWTISVIFLNDVPLNKVDFQFSIQNPSIMY